MTDITCDARPDSVAGAPPAIFAALKTAVGIIRQWRRRARSRCELATYSHHERGDLGFAAADIDAEIAKPFWRE